MNNHDLVEIEFLSILGLNQNVMKLLQIKPKYLQNPKYQKLMEAMIYSYEKEGVISPGGLYSYKNEAEIMEIYCDVITEENLPVTKEKERFMICQKVILDVYKKKVINDLSEKLRNGNLKSEPYLEKMAKINSISIKDETNILTKEELEKNIDTELIGINLPKFSRLDETLKLVQGDFLIIGASTGVGKSGLLLNLMNTLMNKYQCIYFNMEMSKSTIYKRMIAIRADVPVSHIARPETEYQKELIKKAMQSIIADKPIIEHKSSYIHEIKAILGSNKDKRHTILFIDHIGLVKISDKKSIYEQTTDIAKQLRQFCLEYDCTIIAASQLNRASYNSENLNLSMLKDSGELENSSSKVILLYKNKEETSKSIYEENMILDIVKNRDGMLGQIKCRYDKSKQVFREVQEWN